MESGARRGPAREPRAARRRRLAGNAGRRGPHREPTATASTWSSRSPRPPPSAPSSSLVLFGDLLADPLEGAPQDARDVHLRVADLVGDLRLGHVLDEAQAAGSAARARRAAAGRPPAPVCRRSARSPRPRRRPTPRRAIRPLRRRPAGRARAAGGCGWPPAPRALRPGRSPVSSAISPTEGERCSSTVSAVVAFSTSAIRSCRPRGTRTVQTRSRKWRFSSPRMVGEAKAAKGVPRAGSKRSTALTRPRFATCSRSSKDSLAPR